MSFSIVVLSPPGMISPSRPSRSSRLRTYTGVAPSRCNARPCASKSPCNESTPTRFMEVLWSKVRACSTPLALPAARLHQFGLGHLGDVEPGHCFAEFAAGFQELPRILVILGGP